MSNSQSEYFDYNWLLPSLGWAGPCYTERKQRTRRPSAVHRCWAAHGHRWIPTWMEGLKDVGEEREKSETSLNSPGGAWSIKSAATLTWKYSWLIPTEFSALQFTINVNVVTFSASLRGSSFSAAILVAAEEEISEILSQEILAGKCNDITHKSQNFEKTTFRAICFHDSSFWFNLRTFASLI